MKTQSLLFISISSLAILIMALAILAISFFQVNRHQSASINQLTPQNSQIKF